VLIPALLPPRAFGYDPALEPYAFAPATAQYLLREAGYGHGMAITLIATAALEVQAIVVSKMLEQAGFTVQRQLLDDAAFQKAVEFVPHPSGLLSLAETAVTAQHWSIRKQKASSQER
jgi:ABC-type transport system substrate-binding protein